MEEKGSRNVFLSKSGVGLIKLLIDRLGLGPTGAASKPENNCRGAGKLSGLHLTYNGLLFPFRLPSRAVKSLKKQNRNFVCLSVASLQNFLFL